uniref:Uncharacterized protein n=1 Tax=Heliothis virescens TaxID=7102 RepID=A0A2A4K2H2_HELVI
MLVFGYKPIVGDTSSHNIIHYRRIIPPCNGFHDGVGTGPHSAEQRGRLLSNDGMEAINVCLCEHARSTAETGQSHQHPKPIIILDAQGAESPQCIVGPQAARVEHLTISFKKRYFNLFATTCKPACQHVTSNCQRPTFPLNIYMILKVIGHVMSQIFELIDTI